MAGENGFALLPAFPLSFSRLWSLLLPCSEDWACVGRCSLSVQGLLGLPWALCRLLLGKARLGKVGGRCSRRVAQGGLLQREGEGPWPRPCAWWVARKSHSRACASHREPLPREEVPFVHMRAVREHLGRAAHLHSDHQGAQGGPGRAVSGGEPSVTPGLACSPRADDRT